MNILLYGNCQLYAIKQTLSLSQNKYKITLVECWQDIIDKNMFTNSIKSANVIITQPINDNYRDLDYLSTNYIISQANQDCKIIIFDSCYFDFYYFDLTYKHFNNNILRKPIDYHYNTMIECYRNGNSIKEYIENYVNNVDLKTAEELNTIAENSLNELQHRHHLNKEKYSANNISIISTYNFIKDNYKNKLLFYSMNHPTKYIIQFICEEIIKILSLLNTIDYNVDVLASSAKCILYKCIQKCINFNIDEELLLTCGKTTIHDITELYFNTYKEIGYS
jgi:hypothetical protein